MKKLLIGILILGSTLVVSGCADKSSQNSAANNQTEQAVVQDNSPSNNDNADINKQTDTTKTNDKNNSTNKDSVKTSENQKESDITKDKETTVKPATKPTKKEAEIAKQTSTPSKNEVVKDRVTQNKDESSKDAMAKYYGTWRIEKVIGYTTLTTADTKPLNKTIVLSKDKYTNNSFRFTINEPKYLIAKVPAKAFCKGYKMDSLKGTGLKGDIVTALDITSSTNPNSDFDELYIQDGYLVYLQDGVFFKCVKQ